MKPETYFQTYENGFWRWEDGDEVLSIDKGRTIAYKPFLAEVLSHLQDDGLPKFGALLLTIIATNPYGLEDINTLFDKHQVRRLRMDDDIASVEGTKEFAFLSRIANLPYTYKRGTRRIQLFMTLFKDSHNHYGLKKSKRITNVLSSNKQLPANITYHQHRKYFMHNDLHILEIISNKYPTEDALVEAIEALPKINDELQLEPKPTDNPALSEHLIESLLEHHKTYKVGALIKRIWSGLDIPQQQLLSSQQPMGGVSDLTNKGAFDRLLISEFANDDMVFLSRLANNEALYLEREVPPDQSKNKRIVLIDASLKTWGTPKTLAHAILLAMAHHPKSNYTSLAYAIGENVVPLGIESREAIIVGLMALEPTLSAADGMRTYFEKFHESRKDQVIFITHKEAIQQTEMQAALAETGSAIQYRVYTNASGLVTVYRNRGTSLHELQRLQLPLVKLWKRPEKQHNKSVHSTKKDESNTAFSYPILLPFARAKTKQRFILDDGRYFFLTFKRELLTSVHADLSKSAMEMVRLNTKLKGEDHAMGRTGEGHYCLLTYVPEEQRIMLLNLNTKEITYTNFIHKSKTPKWHWQIQQAFLFYDGAFHHHGSKGNWRINLEGKVEKEPPLSTEQIKQLGLTHRQPFQFNYTSYSILSNVKSIGIRDNGLVISGHLLHVKAEGNICLETDTGPKGSIQAQLISKTKVKICYAFADGSTVEIHTIGLGILISSSKAIPNIYFPCSLSSSIAMVANGKFAGNAYYRKKPHQMIRFLEVIHDSWELSELKDRGIVPKDGYVLPFFTEMGVDLSHVDDRRELIYKYDTCQFDPLPEKVTQSISTASFNEHYFQPFINHIKNHAATDQTQ